MAIIVSGITALSILFARFAFGYKNSMFAVVCIGASSPIFASILKNVFTDNSILVVVIIISFVCVVIFRRKLAKQRVVECIANGSLMEKESGFVVNEELSQAERLKIQRELEICTIQKEFF